MRHIFTKLVCAASAIALSSAQVAAQVADIVFIVDESGSMGGEQAFLQTFAPDLNARLGAAGVNTVRFGLVGYGDSAVVPRQVNVGGMQFGSAADFATAASTLGLSGGTEDGYAGINFALQNYAFSMDPNATRLVVLVTDEDRDNTDASLTAQSIANDLTTRGVFFAGILNQNVTDPNGTPAIGASAAQTYLDQNGDGQFETSGAPVLTFAGGTTQVDYTDVILSLPNGCFADLNALRDGGTNAQAFAGALADCLIGIVIGPSGGTNPFIIYASRDSMLGFASSFASQLSFRLTGRLSGRDYDNGVVNGNAPLQYGKETQVVTFPTRVFGADLAEDLPQGVREFSVGRLKGFVNLQGEYAETDYDAPFINYEREAFSVVGGLDYEFRPGMIAGVALGYHASDADSPLNTVDAGAFSIGVYGGTRLGQRGYLDASLQYAFGDIDTTRTTAAGTAIGTTDAGVFTASATLGALYEMNGLDINPSIWLGYSHISTDALVETGPGAVTFAPEDVSVFWATPRIDISKPMPTEWGSIVPSVGVGVRFQGGDEGTVTAIAAGGAATPLVLPDFDPVSAVVNLGLAITNDAHTMAARVDYTGTYGANVISHQGNLRLRVAF